MQLPGVAQAARTAEQEINAVHRLRANLRGWARTGAAASVRAARASAGLDGGEMTVDSDQDTIDDPVLAGSLRVAAALAELLPVWQRAPRQVLARLHTLAAADLTTDPDTLGRPRTGGPDVAERLNALSRMVTTPAPWSSVVTVALVHGELLALASFGTADGVVARAAARLTMMSTGLDPRGLSVPEVGHLRSGSRYAEAARAYSDGDLGTWILAVTDSLSIGAAEAASIARAAG